MSLEESDRIAAAGATAPRVTLDDIKSSIAEAHTFNMLKALKALSNTSPDHAAPLDAAGSLGVLTICVLTTRNGFTVIGKSAPAVAANFDPEKGRHFAYEDALRQLWPLMGYALREKLAGG